MKNSVKMNEYLKKYRKDNSESLNAKDKKRYKGNRRKKILSDAKIKYQKHKEKYKEYKLKNKARIAEVRKIWYEKNKEKVKQARKEWYRNNKEYANKVSRQKRFKKDYNLSIEQYNDMVKIQESKCSICNRIPNRLFVDHCHDSGKVRELLCTNCNTGLGQFKDNKEFLNQAIKYLVKHGK